MQLHHDPQTDPFALRSPYHEAERQRLEQLTAEYLARGGQIEQIGHQMRERYPFVITSAKAQHSTPPALLDAPTLAARLTVQAALGATPEQAAQAVGIKAKHARQLIHDFNIPFQHQR